MSLNPIFDKYFEASDAYYFEELFTSKKLHPSVDRPAKLLDSVYVGTSVDDQLYYLRLPLEEFAAAQKVIEKEIWEEGIPQDSYLRTLDDNELIDILKENDKWNRQDEAVARLLLEERKIKINDDEIKKDREVKRTNEKERSGIISTPILCTLYLLAVIGIFINFVLGLAVLITGIIIYTAKTTDINGKSDYVFMDKYRQHGQKLTIVSSIMVVLFWFYLIQR